MKISDTPVSPSSSPSILVLCSPTKIVIPFKGLLAAQCAAVTTNLDEIRDPLHCLKGLKTAWILINTWKLIECGLASTPPTILESVNLLLIRKKSANCGKYVEYL